MKSKLIKLILLLLSLTVIICAGFVSCSVDDDGDDSEFPEDNEPLDGLVLLRKNEAKFNFVISSSAGSAARKAVTTLITDLRNVGVQVGDLVEDKDATKVTECEIIVGPGVRNRPDDCVVSAKDLGKDGYVIKVVGSRVIIAGGTTALTNDTFDKFVEEYLGITKDTPTPKRNIAIDPETNVLKVTQYALKLFTIAGNDFTDYVITYGEDTPPALPLYLQEIVYDMTGKELEVKNDSTVGASNKRIKFALVDDAGEDGFRVRMDGASMLIECSFSTLFDETARGFIDAEIAGKSGSFIIGRDYSYSKHIATVTYEDFGAVGDGKADDFFPIWSAHQQINTTGQGLVFKFTNDDGSERTPKYYIGKTWLDDSSNPKTIVIKTDVDFTGVEFIIDNNYKTVSGLEEYDLRRTKPIFSVSRDENDKYYGRTDSDGALLSALVGHDNPIPIKKGATALPWLKETGVLTATENLIRVQYRGHRDFVRYGSNGDQGQVRGEVVIVDNNGQCIADTFFTFDYADISQIMISSCDDVPITIKGGKFTTRAEQATPEQKANPAYESFGRGIQISRSHVTVTGITHTVVDEATDMGYPSSGFVAFRNSYDSKLTDSKLCGRRVFNNASGTPMGTYDLTMNHSVNVSIIGVTQEKDIKDSQYWGISASNFCKNLKFDRCVISRVDAHCGVWNLDITNSTIGYAINVIGGGTLNITNTIRRVGGELVSLRSDYGATFEGTVNIKNSTLNAYKSWNSKNGSWTASYRSESEVCVIKTGYNTSSEYLKHDFGYTCYLPTAVNIDNLLIGHRKDNDKGDIDKFYSNIYVFNGVANSAFKSRSGQYLKIENDNVVIKEGTENTPVMINVTVPGYVMTETIKYKNMPKYNNSAAKVTTTRSTGSDYTTMNAVVPSAG